VRLFSCALLALFVCACGAGTASAPPPKSAAATPPAPPPLAPAAPAEPAATSSAPAQAAPEPRDEVLPDEVEAGNIGRAALNSVLSAGIGRFLQRVHVERRLEQGRFAGWRLLSLFHGEPELTGLVVHEGDTLMRVNGQSIERPEQFKNVWDSMATSSELVLEIDRAGKRSSLRYKIVD